jgi:hypothetical protein
MVVLSGRAEVVPDAPPATEVTAMLEKYRAGLSRMNDAEGNGFAGEYSTAIRVTPNRVRGF